MIDETAVGLGAFVTLDNGEDRLIPRLEPEDGEIEFRHRTPLHAENVLIEPGLCLHVGGFDMMPHSTRRSQV